MADAAWPALRWEERPWTPTSPMLVSQRLRRQHRGSYRAAVVPAVAELTPALPGDVLAAADEAAAEIARFDADLGADGAPLGPVLLRAEAITSAMIDNVTSGAAAVALAEFGSSGDGTATEVVRTVAATRTALEPADADGAAVVAVHTALLGDGATPPAADGAPRAEGWRTRQVWIGGTPHGPHLASFVPPHHDHVPALMDDLIRFTGRVDLPPLVQVAIAHAQFETIHPFPHGNGRTGRAVIHPALRRRGVTRSVTVPVSAGLLADRAGYVDALTAYRAGDPSRIVATVARALLAAIADARLLVEELGAVRADWDARIVARPGSVPWLLADRLVRRPVVDRAVVAAEIGILSQNSHRAIYPLYRAWVLDEVTGYKRNRIWQATEIFEALDRFTARAAAPSS